MADAFTLAAKQAGTCVVCGKLFNAGDTLHMQNIGGEAQGTKIWLVSPHDECFKQIQAKPELMKAKTGFAAKPKRTPEERYNDAIVMLDKLWGVAKEKALKELPFLPNTNNATLDDNMRDRRILQATFLHNMVLEYTR